MNVSFLFRVNCHFEKWEILPILPCQRRMRLQTHQNEPRADEEVRGDGL